MLENDEEDDGNRSAAKLDIPEGVEVSVRRNQDTDYVFVQNFNRQPVEVKLPVEQYPVWLGKYDGNIDGSGTEVTKTNPGKKECLKRAL